MRARFLIRPSPFTAALLALIAVLPAPARAGVVVNGGAAGFQSIPSLNQGGPEYWDSSSFDGSNANVGFFLNKSGYYNSNFNATSPAIPLADMQYWGLASGAADANFTFGATGRVQVDLLLTLAGDHAVNEFGWYSAGNPASMVKLFQNGYNAGDGTQTIVFGNNAGYGVTPLSATFKPGGDFGFYLKNGLGQTFYSESSLNTSGASTQLFAVFRSLLDPSGSVLYLGTEDRLNGDFDYNDVVVRIQSIVPEPSSLALVGAAGLALAAGRLRRLRTFRKS